MPRSLVTKGDRVRNKRTGATGVVRHTTPWSVWVTEDETGQPERWDHEEIETAGPGGTAV